MRALSRPAGAALKVQRKNCTQTHSELHSRLTKQGHATVREREREWESKQALHSRRIALTADYPVRARTRESGRARETRTCAVCSQRASESGTTQEGNVEWSNAASPCWVAIVVVAQQLLLLLLLYMSFSMLLFLYVSFLNSPPAAAVVVSGVRQFARSIACSYVRPFICTLGSFVRLLPRFAATSTRRRCFCWAQWARQIQLTLSFMWHSSRERIKAAKQQQQQRTQTTKGNGKSFVPVGSAH